MTQPPSGGCVLKQQLYTFKSDCIGSAAFRRLCVETPHFFGVFRNGGHQPPSGGCVLKRHIHHADCEQQRQPPSGGCVLKLTCEFESHRYTFSAAFRRLCVETRAGWESRQEYKGQPPSGGCVLKHHHWL